MLGVVGGILLGAILGVGTAFIRLSWTNMLTLPVLLLVFAAGYGFSKLCAEMGLTGKSFFRQAYALMLPTVLVYIGFSVARAVIAKRTAMLAAGLVSDAGATATTLISAEPPILTAVLTILFGGLIILPFFIEVRRQAAAGKR